MFTAGRSAPFPARHCHTAKCLFLPTSKKEGFLHKYGARFQSKNTYPSLLFLEVFRAGNYRTRKCDRGEQNADGEAAAKTGLEAIQPGCDPGSILDFDFEPYARKTFAFRA